MAASNKDRGHGFWRDLWVFLFGSIAVLAVLWVTMNAAGTDWSIPVAIVAVIVGGLALIRSERDQ